MTLALMQKFPDRRMPFDPSIHVEIPYELQCYLAKFQQNKSCDFLADLDPYSDAHVPPDVIESLQEQLEFFKSGLRNRNIPEPPKLVESFDPDFPDGTPFGWPGFKNWVDDCRKLIAASRDNGSEVWAVGD